MSNNENETPTQSKRFSFGDRLCARRKELGITQEQLAKIMDISSRMLIRYEKGDALPPFSTAITLSHLLGFSLDGLVTDSEVESMLEKKKKVFEACKRPDLLPDDEISITDEEFKRIENSFNDRQRKIVFDNVTLLKSRRHRISTEEKNKFLSFLVFCFTADFNSVYVKSELKATIGDPSMLFLNLKQRLAYAETYLNEIKNWQQEDLVPLMQTLAAFYAHCSVSCEQIEILKKQVGELENELRRIDPQKNLEYQDLLELSRWVEEANPPMRNQKEDDEHNTEKPETDNEVLEDNSTPDIEEISDDTIFDDDPFRDTCFAFSSLGLAFNDVQNELTELSNWRDIEKLRLTQVMATLYYETWSRLHPDNHPHSSGS